MEKRWDIFGVGTSAVDDLLLVDRFPQPDEKIQIEARQRQGGGQTATALVAAARQGARTAFCGRLGEDELSLFTLRELEREGIDCAPVIRATGSRPVHAAIIVDTSTGSRTILYTLEGFQEPEPGEIDPGWVTGSRVVFFDQNAPRAGLWAARLAHTCGIPVIADIEKITTPGLEEILAEVDHLIVSIEFARRLTGLEEIGAILRALAGRERAALVVTWGANGCWYSESGGKAAHFPAFQVPVVDTTGCGDVFHGAYAAAIARGEGVPRAVAIASATAAIKATRAGGRAGIPDLPGAERLLKEAGW